MARPHKSKRARKQQQKSSQIQQREKGNQAVPQTVSATKVEHFQGPIPSPDALQRYESLLPGAAERIVSMAEKEQTHRHNCETQALQQEIENHQARNTEIRRGQWFGFLIGLSAILSGTLLAYTGHPWPGSFIGTGGVIGLVAVFVFGHRSSKAPEKRP